MSILRYLYLRLAALIIRTLARLPGRILSNPDVVRHIPSRDPRRTIKAHLYHPSDKDQAPKPKPKPVLLNFHGSGFMIPAHGSDDAFCRQISRETGYTVLDVQYRLAPEHPFPAAIEDVQDVARWVLNQPETFDLSRVSISGFSAGANLALVATSSLFPPGTFRSVLAFYPSVAAFIDPYTLLAPEKGGRPIPAFVLRLFRQSYVQSPEFSLRDPRIAPSLAEPSRFPRNVLFITAGYDTLALEAEKLAARLDEDPGRRVVHERMDKCDHAWDKLAREGTRGWELKERAYRLAVEMLEI
ncbi:uncharacterized protein APUU_30240A [Aspergillus puulaauensis]|uniref:Alpha/beta hydrolase fold-3 domain-containing protein n=1 Tax=Aspergillus puulaauensis TaxID=1220207 RepID=A0A7R8ALT0_9EURO|nr:uncharacterized protein APUU_30240A [Aspergillus puulaauensis]BCS22015.1 hypothetical protein APUU_30240A [Aspergillus puulaauensis]